MENREKYCNLTTMQLSSDTRVLNRFALNAFDDRNLLSARSPIDVQVPVSVDESPVSHWSGRLVPGSRVIAHSVRDSDIMFGTCEVKRNSRITFKTARPACFLYLALSGKADVWNDENPAGAEPGLLELIPVHRRVDLAVRVDIRAVYFAIPTQELLPRLKLNSDKSPVMPVQPIRLGEGEISAAAKLLRGCLEQTATLMEDSKPDQIDRLGELLLGFLLEAILDSGQLGEAVHESATPWYVGVIEQYIAGNIAQPISIADLACASGVSPRTLQEGFRRYKGHSPMRFLREQRLTAARNELLNPRENTTVANAAFKWGFNHLGRFSGYYSEHFGEPPSRTLRLARLKCDKQ